LGVAIRESPWQESGQAAVRAKARDLEQMDALDPR